jgi:hypothetical protein
MREARLATDPLVMKAPMPQKGAQRRRASLKQDVALGVKEFDGQAGSPALHHDFVVKGV